MTTTSRCRSCGAPILWAVTVNDRRIPLNATPDPAGRVIRLQGPSDPPVVRLARGTERVTMPADQRYTAHFVDCPQSEKWRRDR